MGGTIKTIKKGARWTWRWVLRPLVLLALVRGVYQLLCGLWICPGEWAAEAVLRLNPTFWAAQVGWILVVIVSALLLWLFEWRRKQLTAENETLGGLPPVEILSTNEAPEPSRYTDKEIAKLFTAKYGREYSASQVRRMFTERGFNIESVNSSRLFATTPEEMLYGRTTYYISKSDKDQFEAGEASRISLSEASRMVYTATKDKFTATLAEREGNVEQVYAYAFFRSSDVPIFGRAPSSQVFVRIPKNHLADFRLSDDTAELKEDGPNGKRYVDLQIYKSDLPRLVALIKGQPV